MDSSATYRWSTAQRWRTVVGTIAVVYIGEFLLGKALALPAKPFMTKLFADKSIPNGLLRLLTIFILAPLNE
ncbi:TPA: hypothetical protein ACG31J_005128 [Escherichia coli]